MTKKSKPESGTAKVRQPTTTTCGEWLSDGTLIELVRPDPQKTELALLVSKGDTMTKNPRAQHEGQSYVPVEPDASILRAIYIPCGVSEYGTTRSLFAEVCDVFASRADLSDTTATLLGHFVLSTWFADCLSTAPQMLVLGPQEEATILLQLLAVTCRRALLLSDVSIATWSSLPTSLRPTLIINARRLRASTLDFLQASSVRHQYVVRKGQLLDLFGAKVIYERTPSGARSLIESAICVTLTPAHGRLPVVSDQDREQIANALQRKLLLYRLMNYNKVRESQFDVPQFTAAVRTRARILGACVVDDTNLQSRLVSVLRGQDDEARITRSFSLESVLVEALLFLCHDDVNRASASVGDIAKVMNTILKGRGEPLELEPRKVGDVLRDLQFFPSRQSSAARGISLLVAERRRIHLLARDYDVPAIHDGVVGCLQCAEAEISQVGDGSVA